MTRSLRHLTLIFASFLTAFPLVWMVVSSMKASNEILASPLSRGITGTTIYVDAGYHIMGV